MIYWAIVSAAYALVTLLIAAAGYGAAAKAAEEANDAAEVAADTHEELIVLMRAFREHSGKLDAALARLPKTRSARGANPEGEGLNSAGIA